MSKPASFCTLATNSCKNELLGFLLSLACHHKNTNVVCLADDDTKRYVEACSVQPALNIIWILSLNKYSGRQRKDMEADGTWTDFQMEKTRAIDESLDRFTDTLFLDSDIVIVNEIDSIDKTKSVGVSPHYIRKKDTDRFGYYNGGVLWTNTKKVPEIWREATKTSRFYDQASIEDIVKQFPQSYFEFDEGHNMSWWRIQQADETPEKMAKYFKISKENSSEPIILYKSYRLRFIHTHFNRDQEANFNNFMILLMSHCRPKYCRELAIINRMITNKWQIRIPKQPQPYPFNHTNDSFRELLVLLYQKNKDIELIYDKNHNIILEPNIYLYDRDTLKWIEPEIVQKSQTLFLGNGGESDIKELKSAGIFARPWIYWPRRPMIIEKSMGSAPKPWSERTIESIFIGNIENSIQRKFREGKGFNNYIQEFHLTNVPEGEKYKFTPQEYIQKISQAKFGLTLRGFGAKCHREIELMAMGTVPIVTGDGLNTSSYQEPLIEGKHFVYSLQPENIPATLAKINENKWTEMSLACHDWYMRNIHSSRLWTTFLCRFLEYSDA